MGATSLDYSTAVKVDGSGNVLVGGYFLGTVDFNPGAATYSLSSGGRKNSAFAGFVLKLNPTGNFVWASHFQADSFSGSTIEDIAMTSSGDV